MPASWNLSPYWFGTKDALGKSVAQNVLSEVANQPWLDMALVQRMHQNYRNCSGSWRGPCFNRFLFTTCKMITKMHSGGTSKGLGS